jgi:hypothetical protein
MDKQKNEKRKNEHRPWWVWSMMALAAIGVCIVMAQSLDILPDRSDFAATRTAQRSTRTSLDDLRATSTPVPTPTQRFTLPEFVLPERQARPTSDFTNIIPTVAYKLISPRQVYPNPMPLVP